MTLVCGLPNAGKTTYTERFERVVHFDDIRARTVSEQYEKCNQAAAKAGGEICVEGVYNTRTRRAALLEAVKDQPGPKICVLIETPVDECLRREARFRRRNAGVVLYQARIFERPTYEEGWDKIITISEETP